MINCTFENGNKASLRHAIIDAIVIQANKILMVKRIPEFLEGGKWGVIGGFVERDETTKQTVAREVREETGYEVDNIKLLTIRDNPDRPGEDRQNIAFVFFCDAGKQTGKPDSESTEIKWFDLDNLPEKKDVAFDHYQSVQLYLDYKRKNLTLPTLL